MSWSTLNISKVLYLIKYIISDDKKITCYLSDFKYIWKETLKINDILKRANDLNPLIEHNEKTILDTIVKPSENCQLNDGNNSNENPDDNLDVDTELKIFRNKYYMLDVPFKFLWKLKLCSQNIFFNEITKPLLSFVSLTSLQQNELKDILRKKDIEIEQYKIEGAQLIRKTVSTLPFNEKQFNGTFIIKNSIENENNSFIEITKNEKQLNNIENFCDIEILKVQQNDTVIEQNKQNINNKLISPNKRDGKKSLKDIVGLRKFQSKVDTKLVYNEPTSSQDDNYGYDDDVNSASSATVTTAVTSATTSTTSTTSEIAGKQSNLLVTPPKKIKLQKKINL